MLLTASLEPEAQYIAAQDCSTQQAQEQMQLVLSLYSLAGLSRYTAASGSQDVASRLQKKQQRTFLPVVKMQCSLALWLFFAWEVINAADLLYTALTQERLASPLLPWLSFSAQLVPERQHRLRCPYRAPTA